MKIKLGRGHESSSCGFSCYACQERLVVAIGRDYEERANYDKSIRSLASKLGWVRRSFSPFVNIWFCSDKCAYQSIIAQDLTEYWMVEALK